MHRHITISLLLLMFALSGCASSKSEPMQDSAAPASAPAQELQEEKRMEEPSIEEEDAEEGAAAEAPMPADDVIAEPESRSRSDREAAGDVSKDAQPGEARGIPPKKSAAGPPAAEPAIPSAGSKQRRGEEQEGCDPMDTDCIEALRRRPAKD